MTTTYTVIYEHGPNEAGRETWSAYVPDLPGCVSGGTTRRECEAMIGEAIELHIEGLQAEGLPVPQPISEAGTITVVELPAA